MAVPVGMREQGKLEVIVRARALAAYTLQIMANEKKFPPELHRMLGQRIADYANDIHEKCWLANNIRVMSPIGWERRKTLQTEAIQACTMLLSKIDLAAEVYKLPVKRVKFWCQDVIAVQQLIRAWRESDQKRYGKMER